MAGRPSKLDSETVNMFLDTLRGTGNVRTSAERACIGVTTLYRWLELGNKAKSGPFREFRHAFMRAKGDFKAQSQITHHCWANGGIIKEPKTRLDEETGERVVVRDGTGEIVWQERYTRPDLRALQWEIARSDTEAHDRQPEISIENKINDDGISKEEEGERVSIIMQALKLAKEMGMIEFDEPKTIEVQPVKKIE